MTHLKKRFKYDLFPASSHHLFPKLIRNFFDRTERVVQPKIKLSNRLPTSFSALKISLVKRSMLKISLVARNLEPLDLHP